MSVELDSKKDNEAYKVHPGGLRKSFSYGLAVGKQALILKNLTGGSCQLTACKKLKLSLLQLQGTECC